MRRALPTLAALLIAVAALASGAEPVAAQDAPVIPDPLAVGAVAPDFSIPGATRHGVLAEPVTLKEYEGKTVVLAFFFRARTRG
ncbi:MAG: peroxiredoxin family protein [Gemmatimonadetes bacterium]|nr:peroxiredoxin family protein [Gemmatimonadota bacterium]